jgi:hypothetical protein
LGERRRSCSEEEGRGREGRKWREVDLDSVKDPVRWVLAERVWRTGLECNEQSEARKRRDEETISFWPQSPTAPPSRSLDGILPILGHVNGSS